MPGGALTAAAATGLSVAAILALKRRIGTEWLSEHVLPEPFRGDKEATAGSVSAHHIVEAGNVGRGFDMNRRTRCCAVPAAQRSTDQRCVRAGRPTPCRTTPHWGVDIVAQPGTPVRAAKAGRVTHAAAQGGYGYCIHIAHSDGQQSTLYAHLSRMDVNAGDTVSAGQVIGAVGNSQFPPSGMGAHLHFEVHPTPTPRFGAARRLEPQAWLRQHNIQPVGAPQRLAFVNPPDYDTDANVFPGYTGGSTAMAGLSDFSMPPIVVLGGVAIATGAALLAIFGSGKR